MRHAVFHSFCICNDLALSLIFTSFFPCLMGFSLSFSLNFHVHLWSTAKLNCLSLRRWTALARPGWQATRTARWMGTPTRARMTSSWWNSMPRVSTCGRASAVVRAMTMLTPFRRTGCDFVFESFPWRKGFRFSCEVHVPSQVEWHHSVRININLCAFQKVIPRGLRELFFFESIDALSLVSLSPWQRLDAVGTWSSISTKRLFKI